MTLFLALSQCFSKHPLGDLDIREIKTLFNSIKRISVESLKNFIHRKQGDLGETLLHYYAGSVNEPNGEEACDLLIAYGAQINFTDNFERTPLHRAVVARKFSMTRLLLNHGAFVNAQDANKNTPLHIANTVDFQLYDLLLKRGADPNIKNNLHESPVLRVVQVVNNALPQCKQIVKLLLHYGGNVVLRDLNRQNAIEVASRFGNKDVFDLCKQNVQNSTGKTLILIKLDLSSFEVVKPSSQASLYQSFQFSLNSFTQVLLQKCTCVFFGPVPGTLLISVSGISDNINWL